MKATATPTLAELRRIMDEDEREMPADVLDWAIACLTLRVGRIWPNSPASARYEQRLRTLNIEKGKRGVQLDAATELALRMLGCSPALLAQFEQACQRQETDPDVAAWNLIHDYAELHNPHPAKTIMDETLRRLP